MTDEGSKLLVVASLAICFAVSNAVFDIESFGAIPNDASLTAAQANGLAFRSAIEAAIRNCKGDHVNEQNIYL